MSELPLKRQDFAIALALAAVTLVAGFWRMAPGVCGKLHDDAIYVSTAKALASGQGYRQIDLPGAPLQTKYPVLYPAMLAAVWRIWPSFPENLLALQAVGVLCAAGALAIGFLYVVRFGYFSRPIAAGAALLCAVSPYFLYFAVHTMAEMPFALLSIVALWCLESFLSRTAMTKRGQFACGAALALPFLCRTIGAVFLVAGLFVAWRRGRPLFGYACGAALAAAPWIVWSYLGRGIWDQNPIDGYYTDYVGCWSSTGLALTHRVFLDNSLMIAYGTVALWLEAALRPLEMWLGEAGACAVLMLLGVAAWLSMTRDLCRTRALPWMLAAYLAAMLVWPWPPFRFLVPVLPFLVAYSCAGSTAVLSPWWKKAGVKWAAAAALCTIVLANGVLLAHHGLQVRQTRFPVIRLRDATVDWSSYENLFAWLNANSDNEDVVAAELDSMVALYTGRAAFCPFVYDPGHVFYGQPRGKQAPHRLAEVLRHYHPRYLVLSPAPDVADEKVITQALEELKANYPGWLQVAWQDTDPRFVVYELHYESASDLVATHGDHL